MSYSTYSDEEMDRVRLKRRERSPAPVHYVEARRERPRSRAYYEDPFHDAPMHDRMVTTTRIRERSRERRSPPAVVAVPAPPPQPVPVIINNKISDHHHYSSDDDSSTGSYYHRGRGDVHVSYRRHSHSHSHSRSRAGSDAYLTVDRYEMQRKLDETRRQLEFLRLSAPHSDQGKYELERERDRLRRERRELEQEAEERDRAAQRAHEAEMLVLRRSKAELDRLRIEQQAEKMEEERLGVVKRDAEYRLLKDQQLRDQREKAAEERRLHELEDLELREAKRKLARIEQRDRMEKEANERARDAKTQAELKAAKEELDKSKFDLISFSSLIRSAVIAIEMAYLHESKHYCDLLHLRSQISRWACAQTHPSQITVIILIGTMTIYPSDNFPLSTVRQAKQEEAERDRIIKEHALAELEKKQAAEAAAEARKKADAEAVARWHVEQAEKAAKEKAQKEEEERELRNKMRERLLASGVPEHQIQAMIDGKRPAPPQMMPQPMPMMRPGVMGGGVGPGVPPPPPMHHPHQHPRPHPHPPANVQVVQPPNSNTYTRMSRKHLSIEALRARAIDFELDKVCTCHYFCSLHPHYCFLSCLVA